ncbi:MAG: hypothetical protein HFJ35_02720 [Clostridia bacterium]|nr:hypothetical protein [Clostridia bacterium]
MLSPEYLNLIEFNDVVELYNKLNEEITVDIITRVAQMQNITETTRKQLEILKQTNGTEIFNKALEKTSMLKAETKKALKQLFEDMVKQDIEGYKELYEYRDKPFQLSESQYKILNQGLKETNRILKNFTNTIAFQSQQAYVEAIDNAYMKVSSGAFDYATAINSACQELANKGITLKDKLGRNVQLEVAVRRNVMTGIQQTANHINRDIEEYLGCDGYEVTAHLGARPSHAEAQGKQYAISHKTKISRDYPLWSEVEGLWSEYNCRHSYFGIVLGISEPVYTDKELKEFKEATVDYNGKKIPYYEATQKQRQLENAIRKQKRTVQTLEKANLDNKIEKSQLAQLQKKYKVFCKETGLEKDYSRLQVASTNLTRYEQYAINKYISADFYPINEKLRNGQELTKEEIKLCLNLDNALNKLPQYNGLVTRSLELDKNELKKFLKEHTNNSEVYYNAYTSTTCGNRYNNKSNIELYIYSQNGKNMLKYNKEENEILYKRGSQFKVKEVELKNNVYYILLEEIDE